uniref:Mucin-19-like n=1 Tax=Petromyzon marinus TaxID=7757 RepID=A0AAJ7U8D9_PETMA|nr:mucin-19-like [Petromyzon marinus]
MDFSPKESPIYGGTRVLVSCAEGTLPPGDADFFLVFDGSASRHVAPATRLNGCTLQGFTPGHDRCEYVSLSLWAWPRGEAGPGRLTGAGASGCPQPAAAALARSAGERPDSPLLAGLDAEQLARLDPAVAAALQHLRAGGELALPDEKRHGLLATARRLSLPCVLSCLRAAFPAATGAAGDTEGGRDPNGDAAGDRPPGAAERCEAAWIPRTQHALGKGSWVTFHPHLDVAMLSSRKGGRRGTQRGPEADIRRFADVLARRATQQVNQEGRAEREGATDPGVAGRPSRDRPRSTGAATTTTTNAPAASSTPTTTTSSPAAAGGGDAQMDEASCYGGAGGGGTSLHLEGATLASSATEGRDGGGAGPPEAPLSGQHRLARAATPSSSSSAFRSRLPAPRCHPSRTLGTPGERHCHREATGGGPREEGEAGGEAEEPPGGGPLDGAPRPSQQEVNDVVAPDWSRGPAQEAAAPVPTKAPLAKSSSLSAIRLPRPSLERSLSGSSDTSLPDTREPPASRRSSLPEGGERPGWELLPDSPCSMYGSRSSLTEVLEDVKVHRGCRDGLPVCSKAKLRVRPGGGRWALGAGRWALGAGRWALGAGRWALGAGRWALGAGRWALGAGRWALGAGRWALGAGRWALGAGRWALGAGRWALGAGRWALGAGRWALGAGRWALGAGRWALGAGRWALGAGRWALGAGRWALGAGRLVAGDKYGQIRLSGSNKDIPAAAAAASGKCRGHGASGSLAAR